MEPKQIDVLTSGMGKLLYQWKDSPNLQALMRALLLQLKDVETTFYQLLNQRGIYTAFGAQLDVLGKLVGETRNGRDDETFRQAILGGISVNRASGTINDVKYTAKIISNSSFAALFEHYPLATYIFVPAYVSAAGEKAIDDSHMGGVRTRVLWTEEPENIIYPDLDEASYTELLETGDEEQIVVNDGGIYELQVSFSSFTASESYFTSLVPGATTYQTVDDKGKMASLVPLQEVKAGTGYIIDQDGNYIVDNFGNYIRYVIFGEFGSGGGEPEPQMPEDVTSDRYWFSYEGPLDYSWQGSYWEKSSPNGAFGSGAWLYAWDPLAGEGPAWYDGLRPTTMTILLNSGANVGGVSDLSFAAQLDVLHDGSEYVAFPTYVDFTAWNEDKEVVLYFDWTDVTTENIYVLRILSNLKNTGPIIKSITLQYD